MFYWFCSVFLSVFIMHLNGFIVGGNYVSPPPCWFCVLSCLGYIAGEVGLKSFDKYLTTYIFKLIFAFKRAGILGLKKESWFTSGAKSDISYTFCTLPWVFCPLPHNGCLLIVIDMLSVPGHADCTLYKRPIVVFSGLVTGPPAASPTALNTFGCGNSMCWEDAPGTSTLNEYHANL